MTFGSSTAKVLRAIEGTKLREVDSKTVALLVKRCCATLGVSGQSLPTPAELPILIEMLQGEFGNYTIEEVDLAFRSLVTGKLEIEAGTFNRLTPPVLNKVLRAYVTTLRYEARKTITEPQKSLTEAEKRQIIENNIVVTFAKYKEDEKLLDAGGAIYRYLEKIGAINLTIEKKREIYNRAEREELLQGGDFAAMRELYRMTGIERNDRIRDAARLIALREYFDHLIEFNMDINEVLEDGK